MSHIRHLLLSTGAMALLFTGLVAAQNADRMATDSNFVTKAAQGGAAEVELGKLAQSRGSSDKVKQFGQRMVDDHSKAGAELAGIASQKGVTVPSDLTSTDQATKDRLSGLNGRDFDLAYMQDMVKDHKQDVSEFQKEASSGKDPDVKAFAAKTLPTLREHLKMAEQTLADIKK